MKRYRINWGVQKLTFPRGSLRVKLIVQHCRPINPNWAQNIIGPWTEFKGNIDNTHIIISNPNSSPLNSSVRLFILHRTNFRTSFLFLFSRVLFNLFIYYSCVYYLIFFFNLYSIHLLNSLIYIENHMMNLDLQYSRRSSEIHLMHWSYISDGFFSF